MKYLINANFHVFVPVPEGADGKPRPEAKKVFGRGQVIDESDIPDGQSAEDWISKGLATAADAA